MMQIITWGQYLPTMKQAIIILLPKHTLPHLYDTAGHGKVKEIIAHIGFSCQSSHDDD